MNINYGTTITNATATGIDIDICGVDGATGATGNTAISGGVISLTVGECNVNESIDVSGVLLAIAGQGLTSVSANITSSGDVRLGSGANEVTVINSVVDELTDDGVSTDTLTVIRHTGDPEGDSAYFKLLIEENAVDSFTDTVLDLDFSGLESGMTVTIDAWVSTKENLGDLKPSPIIVAGDDPSTMDVDETADTDAGTPGRQNESTYNVDNMSQLAFEGGEDTADSLEAVITSMSSSAGVRMHLGNALNSRDNPLTTAVDETSLMFGGSLSPTEVDVVVIRGKIAFAKPPSRTAVSFPLDALDITATVNVGPVGAAVPPMRGPAERGIPRFGSDPTTPRTVIGVTSDKDHPRGAVRACRHGV